MAAYDFTCGSCGEDVERNVPIEDCDKEQFCHRCEGKLRKVIRSVPSIRLRGAVGGKDGWRGPTVREVQRRMEDSPEYKSGELQPKGTVRWV